MEQWGTRFKISLEQTSVTALISVPLLYQIRCYWRDHSNEVQMWLLKLG